MFDPSERELIDALSCLDDERTISAAKKLIGAGADFSAVDRCLDEGLNLVRQQFEEGSYFIADLMYSGMLYRSVLELFPTGAASGLHLKKELLDSNRSSSENQHARNTGITGKCVNHPTRLKQTKHKVLGLKANNGKRNGGSNTIHGRIFIENNIIFI